MDTEERGRKKTACVAIDAYHLCERWQDHRTNADIREWCIKKKQSWIQSERESSSYLATYAGCQKIGFPSHCSWDGWRQWTTRKWIDILEWCSQDVKRPSLITEDRDKWRRFVASRYDLNWRRDYRRRIYNKIKKERSLPTGGLVFFAVLCYSDPQQRWFQAKEAHLASTLSADLSGLAQVTGSCR